jgi:hypothetical protein
MWLGLSLKDGDQNAVELTWTYDFARYNKVTPGTRKGEMLNINCSEFIPSRHLIKHGTNFF